jgi:hypothetical protein
MKYLNRKTGIVGSLVLAAGLAGCAFLYSKATPEEEEIVYDAGFAVERSKVDARWKALNEAGAESDSASVAETYKAFARAARDSNNISFESDD